MISRTQAAALAIGGIGLSAIAFLAGRVWAGGIPPKGALMYSGELEDAAGTTLKGDHSVEVMFWGVQSGGTSPLCTSSQQTVTLQNGRFSVPLPDSCTEVVKSTTNLWVEVAVDDKRLDRTAVGAVPYAVEAAHVIAADSAASAASASGALDRRIAALEKTAPAPEVLSAASEKPETLPDDTDGAYSPIYLDLTPGTWLVTGQASLGVTRNTDLVRLALFNETAATELAGSASATAQVDISRPPQGFATLPTVATVVANTRIRLYAYRNGSSTIKIGVSGPSIQANMTREAQRLTAIRLSN